MSEEIPIREAARRLGVSDTAVRKAIAAGRVTIAGHHPGNGRPQLAWPQVKAQWEANSDSSKRSHVGGTGKSPARAKYAAAEPMVRLPVSGTGAGPAHQAKATEDEHQAEPGSGEGRKKGPTYAESRAVREAYAARLAKLEYEEKSGKLVNADDVKVGWYRMITAAKTKIMGIPAACKSRRSDLPLEVVAMIESICRETVEDLANGAN